jgi:hypothetical protein
MILPQGFLKENKRGSSQRIFTLFYFLCLSVLFITKGQLGPLAGVYTISFLLVMAYFGYGNFLLKIKRARLPRPEHAPSFVVAIAVMAVLVAIYVNVKLNPEYLVVFLQYFIPSVLVLYILLNRIQILQYMLIIVTSFFDTIKKIAVVSRLHITRHIRKLTRQQFVYFTKGDDISVLNKVMIYVQENEITSRLKIVTVLKEGQEIFPSFLSDFEVLNRAYPGIDIEFIQLKGIFGPQLINQLSKEWNIPANFMFISSPGNRFSHRISDLHGVRLII